jgi:hypothetical protein
MALMPAPGGFDDGVQIGFRGDPAQDGFGFCGVGYEAGGIAGARRFDASANFAAGYFTRCFDDFHHGITVAGAEIQEIGGAAAAQMA